MTGANEIPLSMSEAGKAVFLSYASQDAEAARRICEALRGAGVEVWFDAEGGLEHGDEWDAKIRRQIKECVLFIAVISHNTQAREEGYFRIEWELAAERAMGIASGVAFILPVVIDDTREPDALVPDRFRKVQWTRVPGGVIAPEVRARLLKLWSHRAGAIAHAAVGNGEMETARPHPVAREESFGAPARSPLVLGSVVAGLIAVAALGWWWSRPAAGSAAAVKTPAAPADGKLSEAQRLTARAYGLTQKVGFQREDLATAEELINKATELEPASARAWGVRAWVQAAYLNRNWDRSAQRREDAQKFANRALALDAKEADALNALAQVLTSQGAYAEAEVIGRRAVAADPDNMRSRLTLGRAILFQERDEEARAVLGEAVRREPGHLLARYELASSYVGMGLGEPKAGEVEQAIAHLDAALRVQEFGSALLFKAMLVGARLGHLAEMRALLDAMDRLPPAERSEDRAVFVAMWAGLLEGRPERVLAAAARTARTFFDDSIVASPKAWGTALASQMAGKSATARIEWQAAEAVLRQRLRELPSQQREHAMLAITLAWQDRAEEAARELAPIETLWKEQMGPGSARWLALFYAGQGDAARAVPYLRLAINRMNLVTDYTLLIDPWWQKLRGKAEFEALVAEAKARIASGRGGVFPGSAGAGAGAAIRPTPAAAVPAAVVPPARELVTKALALIRQMDATREDVTLAEDFCQQAMKLDATDAEVWAVYSQVHGTFIYRGWDATPERREQSRVMAERAIRLAPRSALARLAQAGAWTTFGVNRPESEKLLREVLAEQPQNQHVIRFLASVVLSQGRLDEALALMDRSAALPGGDALALYNKARALWARDRPEEAAAALDASLAQGPIASALTMKALINLNWRGDLEVAATAIRQLPGSALLEDRANFYIGLLHFYQRNAAQALAAWGAFPREFYDDFQFNGPKSQLLGDAHELANRPEAAKAEWRVALLAVEKRLSLKPTDRGLLFFKAELLASLGEKVAAEAALRTAQELSGRQFTARTPLTWWQARIYARLGRVDELLAELPLSLANPVASSIRPAALRLDPRFDTLRSDPRFLKLIEAPARSAAP